MTKEYVLTEDHSLGDTTYNRGLTIYRAEKYDYGLASDDTRMTGIEHWSMTLDPAGGYPTFTVPVNKMRENKETVGG